MSLDTDTDRYFTRHALIRKLRAMPRRKRLAYVAKMARQQRARNEEFCNRTAEAAVPREM